MNDKIIFREKLSEIRELAELQGNKLGLKEIKDFFQSASLTDEQMELVYSYLEANKIVVDGHEKSDTIKLFEDSTKEDLSIEKEEENTEEETNKIPMQAEDDKYLNLYLEEIGELPVMEEAKMEELYHQVLKDNPVAKSGLIEIYLPKVVEIAKGYVNRGVGLSDLIQEGNVGLMISLDEIPETATTNMIDQILNSSIITAMENVIEEAESIHTADKQILNRINYLNEGVRNLEEELGRIVHIKELAKYMEMSEEEVTDIIRVSDDEIIVIENEKKKDN